MSAGAAKRVASNAAIAASKGVPVKGVHKIRFEGEYVRFIEGKALDKREILIHINRAADVTEDFRKVAEGVATLGYKAWSVRIEKRSAAEIVVGARTMINFGAIR